MVLTTQRGGTSLQSKKVIFSAACLLGLSLIPGLSHAQDDEAPGDASDPSSDAATDPAEAAASDATPVEDGAADAEDPSAADAVTSGDEAVEGTEDTTSVAGEAASSDEVSEPPEEPSSPEEEPDYFGGLEPSSPIYQLEDPSVPEKPRYMGPFRAGAVRFGLGIGGGGYGDQTYFILGFGVGYYLVNGLELHVDTDFWLIGEPFMATPSPGLRYVMWFIPKVHPYVGGFYRHYFTGSGYPDANSIGARAGVYLMTGRSSYFGIGAAYEHMLDQELFVDTDFIYPEIAFAFAF